MAEEIVRSGSRAIAVKGPGALVKGTKKAAKKHAKKAAKRPGEKSAEKKKEASQGGLRTAFHHMQRAAVVISLMEKGSGEDLRDLLKRGTKLYEKALDGEGDAAVLKSIGLLRAAEHLALAGLYDARHKHREKVEPPRGPWLESFAAETSGRLKAVEGSERGKGTDVFPAAEELVRRALEAAGDPHMAWELALAADALCFALENGL